MLSKLIGINDDVEEKRRVVEVRKRCDVREINRPTTAKWRPDRTIDKQLRYHRNGSD